MNQEQKEKNYLIHSFYLPLFAVQQKSKWTSSNVYSASTTMNDVTASTKREKKHAQINQFDGVLCEFYCSQFHFTCFLDYTQTNTHTT